MAETNNIYDLVDKGVLLEVASGSFATQIQQQNKRYRFVFEFYVYDVETDELLESTTIRLLDEWNISIFITDNRLLINPGMHLRKLGYSAGVYKIKYKFYKNLVGSSFGEKLKIKRISPSRTELEIIPPEGVDTQGLPIPIEEEQQENPVFNPVGGGDDGGGQNEPLAPIVSGSIVNDYISFVQRANSISNANIKQLKTYLNLGNDREFLIINAKDPINFDLLLKLHTPLTNEIQNFDECWIVEEMIPVYEDRLVLYTKPLVDNSNLVFLKSPNVDRESAGIHFRTTPLENFETLATTNVEKKNEIIRYYLSSSIIEGIDINNDYRKFENFVKFSSISERLARFRQKVINIESYESKISLYGSASLYTSASISGSNPVVSSSLEYFRTLKQNTINEFDNYERYLYYESMSYESSSVGEFYESTWPKYTSAPPYYLYSYTSSQAQTWYLGMVSSASQYDNLNKDIFSNFVPLDMQLDDQNKNFVKFINMIGHYYDLVNGYINKMPLWHYKDNAVDEGIAKELIIHAINHYGFDLRSGQTLKSLDDYIIVTSSDFTFTNLTASTIEWQST